MQISDCEKCKLLVDEALKDELPSDSEAFFAAHINECPECKAMYEDLKKLSGIMQATPPVAAPESFHANIQFIAGRGRKQKIKKISRQIGSIAAVLLVFAGSYALYEHPEPEDAFKTNSAYTQEEDAALGEDSAEFYGLPVASSSREISCAYFEEALADPEFLEQVDAFDSGFGYELLQWEQEEDGAYVFVLYFYEEASGVVDMPEETDDIFSLPNVRSFHWKKNGL